MLSLFIYRFLFPFRFLFRLRFLFLFLFPFLFRIPASGFSRCPFESWSWQSFVSTCAIFNCLSPLNIQDEIQLLSRVFRYSWLVCLLGFWLRNTSLVKVGNPISDGIVFVFHLAWCVRELKSLKRLVFCASRMVSLSNYFIWCLFFISNLMKASAVYGAI